MQKTFPFKPSIDTRTLYPCHMSTTTTQEESNSQPSSADDPNQPPQNHSLSPIGIFENFLVSIAM